MGTTPKYKLPWPEMNEPSDGPGGYRKLAEATETALNPVDVLARAIVGIQFLKTPLASNVTNTGYPLGVSLMYLSGTQTSADKGWPTPGAAELIATFRESSNACTQYAYRLDTTKPEAWFRTMGTTANSLWHQLGPDSYRAHYDTNTVAIGKGVWSGIAVKTVDSYVGSDIIAYGNGMQVKRAGEYRVDFGIQMNGGSTVAITCTTGVGTTTGAPSTLNRTSGYCSTSSTMFNGTYLIRLGVDTTVMGWVTHNGNANVNFGPRRLSLHRIG